MRYYYINIQVDFETPRTMPPLTNSEKPWKSVGYFQTFYCTEQSKEEAKNKVHQYFLENEENPSTCQIRYDSVAWMRYLTDIKDLTHGYDSDLTEEMFANRDKIGIWYSGEKRYYVSEEDYAAAMLEYESENPDEIDEDEFWEENEEWGEDDFWNGYEGQCQACDNFGPVDDMSLCDECAGKLERDLIRQRDWAYSASAFGLTNELREKLRNDVINKFGKKFELIACSKKRENKSKRKRKKK